jgi:hypothetical protein
VTASDTRRSGDVAREVVLGVDTHLDFHVVAVALDRLGRPLGELKVPTTTGGYPVASSLGRRGLAP